jgi:CMP-N-acetylneuraminic acid synthetase
MVAGLLIGKDKSLGVPGKNTRPLLNRPSCEYALMAASACPQINRLFVSTDSIIIAETGKKYGATHIMRPPELATPQSLTEDVLLHAFDAIESTVGKPVDLIVLLFANSPAVNPRLLTEGIEALKEKPEYDSAFSVSKYNMFSPARAKKVSADRTIAPFIDLDALGEISSIRDSQGDCYFVDFSVQIMRRSCFTNMKDGQPPLKWIGKKPYALFNDYGFDIDSEWQFVVMEKWLKDHGFTDTKSPW